MRLFLRFLGLLRPYRGALALTLLLVLAITGLAFAFANGFKHLITEFNWWQTLPPAARGASEHAVVLDVYMWGLRVIGIVLLRSAIGAWRSIVAGTVSQRVVFDMRNRLVEHISGLSLRFFETCPTGQLLSRLTSDVDALQTLVNSATVDIVADVVTVAALGGAIIWISPRLAFLTLLLSPLILGGTTLFGRKMRTVSRALQAQLALVSGQILETVSGIRVVQGFNVERRERRRFHHVSAEALRLGLRRLRLQNLWSATMDSGVTVATMALAVAGLHEIVAGRMSPGNVAYFTALLYLIPMPVQRIAIFNDTLQRGLASAERVFEILDTTAEVHSLPGARPVERVRGGLRFDNVGFAYGPDRDVLKGITMDIPPGATVALVGPSGAGKSTLANLLVRFYDPTEGSLCVDGEDIRAFTLSSWRRQIGLVLQDTFLFNGNARENIALGRQGATNEEIHAAAVAANADEFLQRLPQGYDTQVGERGMKLSGGERQRIAIARAILRDPPILILDEATSSLDTESERLIQGALDRLLEGRTALVIAHRLSTIQRADRIVVLDGGRIVEQGTHDALLALDGLYARLYHTQFQAPPARRPYSEPSVTDL